MGKKGRNRPLKTWFDQALSQNNFWWCLIEILTFLHCVICWRSHLCPISTGPILPTFSSTLTMTIPEMKNNFIRNIRGSFRSKNDQKSKKGKLQFFPFFIILSSTIKSANSKVWNWLGRYNCTKDQNILLLYDHRFDDMITSHQS